MTEEHRYQDPLRGAAIAVDEAIESLGLATIGMPAERRRHIARTLATAAVRAFIGAEVPALDWKGGNIDPTAIKPTSIYGHIIFAKDIMRQLQGGQDSRPLEAEARLRGTVVAIDQAIGWGYAGRSNDAAELAEPEGGQP